MKKTPLYIKKLHTDAKLPKYATPGAACFDLSAIVEGNGMMTSNEKLVTPYQPVSFRTGLAFEVPEGYAMLVFSRSGHGFNNGVRLSNCVGVIDSDYRGEVLVKLHCDAEGQGVLVKHGDRIAQAGLVKMEQVEMFLTDELNETQRGEGGFGHTGQ